MPATCWAPNSPAYRAFVSLKQIQQRPQRFASCRSQLRIGFQNQPRIVARGRQQPRVHRPVKIWDDPDAFDRLIKDAKAEADKLVEVAAAGDIDAIREQIGSVGRNACRACHLDFAGKVSYNLQTVPPK